MRLFVSNSTDDSKIRRTIQSNTKIVKNQQLLGVVHWLGTGLIQDGPLSTKMHHYSLGRQTKELQNALCGWLYNMDWKLVNNRLPRSWTDRADCPFSIFRLHFSLLGMTTSANWGIFFLAWEVGPPIRSLAHSLSHTLQIYQSFKRYSF